jgi:hypothetical protein
MDASHALLARQQEAGRRWRVFPGSMIAESAATRQRHPRRAGFELTGILVRIRRDVA